MASATVTSKGQITIPAEVRSALDLKPGDKIDFVKVGDRDFRLFARTGSVKRLRGMFGKFPRTISIEEMNEAIAERGSRLR
ncbi:AbrB/MazE/SpoVT family DNA-binding domain-containing protein [Acidicapsa dinghuensis]|uniref:AbrB/MazE/SpoVT family DNA-binding domain-containing protein n=1 Tax=Acidicapsa dinghuensis TaxID=2218256 RepID=A0ABW1EFB3_9BACT